MRYPYLWDLEVLWFKVYSDILSLVAFYKNWTLITQKQYPPNCEILDSRGGESEGVSLLVALMMEAVSTSETSVSLYETTPGVSLKAVISSPTFTFEGSRGKTC
jgi:hypothetical protein